MIEITFIIILFITLILFKIYNVFDEVKIIVTGLIVSSFCYYVALNIGNINLSLIFMYLTVISIIFIPILILIKYFIRI